MQKMLWLGLALLVLAMVGYIYTGQIFTPPDNQPAQTANQNLLGATFTYLEGAVEYQSQGGKWQRAELSTNLYQGDSVEVIGEGKAIIQLDEGSVLRLNSDAKITLSSLEPDNIVIANLAGEVYNRVVTADRTYTVTIDNTEYESLGTAFKTACYNDTKGVEVYQNQVMVKKNGEEIIVEQGKKYQEESNQVEDLDLSKIDQDMFLAWNKEQDKQHYQQQLGVLAEETAPTTDPQPTPEPAPTPTPTPVSGISLSGSVTETGVKFNWSVSGLETPQGFKLVKSAETNPVYPGNSYIYLSDSNTRSYHWNLQDGQTYYFRVCQYLGGKCGVYSNNVKLTVPKKTVKKETPTSAVNSISLTGSDTGVSWTVDGTSKQGFKIVWSKTSGPTYPCRGTDKYIYLSSADASSTNLHAFDGAGTYYVRVCEYLGGKCGQYSNQITLDLE